MILHLGGTHSVPVDRLVALLPLDGPAPADVSVVLGDLKSVFRVHFLSKTPKTLALVSENDGLHAYYCHTGIRTLLKRAAQQIPMDRL